MGGTNWPRVRRIKTGWLVDSGRVLPIRTRKRVPTREAMETLVASLRDERKALQATARFERANRVISLTGLDDAARRDVLEALDTLAGRGNLTMAAKYFVQHYVSAHAVPVETLIADYIEGLRVGNRRPRTILDVKGKVGAFASDNGRRAVQSISRREIDQWLSSEGRKRSWGPASRNAYRQALHGFFNYAVRRELIEINPVHGVTKATVDQNMPDVLTVREVRRLIGASRRVEEKLVPYVVIGLFCGLRPENELAQLDWSDIDLERKTLLVRPASAKKRRLRYVDLSENLIEFLRPFQVEEGRIFFSRYWFRGVVEMAKLKWTRDVMRHTYASYHLGQHQNAALTALQLGHHGDTTVLFSHYRNLVRREEAARFWSMRPLPVAADSRPRRAHGAVV